MSTCFSRSLHHRPIHRPIPVLLKLVITLRDGAPTLKVLFTGQGGKMLGHADTPCQWSLPKANEALLKLQKIFLNKLKKVLSHLPVRNNLQQECNPSKRQRRGFNSFSSDGCLIYVLKGHDSISYHCQGDYSGYFMLSKSSFGTYVWKWTELGIVLCHPRNHRFRVDISHFWEGKVKLGVLGEFFIWFLNYQNKINTIIKISGKVVHLSLF